jgi:hypothetical protein
LSFGAGPATGGTAGGSGAWNQGDWNINMGGSAPSIQGLAGGSSLLWVALAVGAAWLLLRK